MSNNTAQRRPSATVEAQLLTERDSLAGVSATVAELTAERTALLLNDDDDARLAKHDASLASAQRAHDRHAARVEHLERELAAVEKAEAQEAQEREQRETWLERKSIVDAGHLALAQYPKIAQQLADCFEQIRAADRVVKLANKERPEHEAPLVPPSATRHVPIASARVELRKEVAWVDAYGNRITGAVSTNERGEPNVRGARRDRVDVEYTIPGDIGWQPAPIYEAIEIIPGVGRHDQPYWKA